MNPEDDPRVTALVAELRQAAEGLLEQPPDPGEQTRWTEAPPTSDYATVNTELMEGAPVRSSPSQGGQVTLGHLAHQGELLGDIRDAMRGIHLQHKLQTLELSRIHHLGFLVLWVVVFVSGALAEVTLVSLVVRYFV